MRKPRERKMRKILMADEIKLRNRGGKLSQEIKEENDGRTIPIQKKKNKRRRRKKELKTDERQRRKKKRKKERAESAISFTSPHNAGADSSGSTCHSPALPSNEIGYDTVNGVAPQSMRKICSESSLQTTTTSSTATLIPAVAVSKAMTTINLPNLFPPLTKHRRQFTPPSLAMNKSWSNDGFAIEDEDDDDDEGRDRKPSLASVQMVLHAVHEAVDVGNCLYFLFIVCAKSTRKVFSFLFEIIIFPKTRQKIIISALMKDNKKRTKIK
jgi:hypothetical protein